MSDDRRVELHRAVHARDLWPLIESAQYARVVLHDPPAGRAEAQAIECFADGLSTAVENWSEIARRNAAPMLRDLDAKLNALAGMGLFVHGGCVERAMRKPNMAQLTMPLAVIRIGHDRRDRLTVHLPDDLVLALSGGEGS